VKSYKVSLPFVLGAGFLLFVAGASLALFTAGGARVEAAAPTIAQRAAWVKEGTAWAAYTESLTYLIRRGGDSADVAKKWGDDFTEETVRKVKQDGANAVVVNLHKGFGLKAEAADVEAARKFVEIVHRHGMKAVGYAGASIMYETMLTEEPDSRDWIQVDEWGQPIYYTGEQTFRYMACRNSPGYRAFVQKVLRTGIEYMKLDGVHFDQLGWSNEPYSCRCKYCRAEFQKFLRERYSDDQLKLRFGFTRLDHVVPPPYTREFSLSHFVPMRNPMIQDWARFRATSLAQRLGEYDTYIHQLNPQAILRYNPHPMEPAVNVGYTRGIDVQQLLQHGDMVTTEEVNQPRWTSDGRLVSKIRSFKAARIMDKTLWMWQEIPKYSNRRFEGPLVLRLAEAIAYNDMCLGVITGRDVPADTLTPEARRYVNFFWQHTKDLRQTTPVGDVAVLRSFSSIEFNPAKSNVSTVLFEQSLIQSKIPFHIIYDRHLTDQNLGKYKVLVLANQDALSDEQVGIIRRFVQSGGGLVASEDTSLLTDWRLARDRFALADAFGQDRPPAASQGNKPIQRTFGKGRVVYIPRIESSTPPPPPDTNYNITNRYWTLPKNHAEMVAAVKWAAREQFSAEVEAPLWVTMELARQPGTNSLLLHLLNFKTTAPVADIQVKLNIPAGMKVKEAVVETPDGGGRQVLSVVGNGQTVSFRVPALKIYDLVLLRLEKL